MDTPHSIIESFRKQGSKFHIRMLNQATDLIKDQLPGISIDPSEDLFLIKENLSHIPCCPICNSNRKFIDYKKGYQNTCHTKKCINKYKQLAREAAFIQKYGVKNPKQVPEIRERITATMVERYGSENPYSSDLIKERIKDTLIDRYGFDHPMKIESVVNKIKDTNIERYGVDNTYQLPKVLNKIKEKYGDNFGWGSEFFMRRSRETFKKNHGVEYYLMTREAHIRGTQTMNEIYGGRGLGSESIKNKIEDSIEEQYGARHPMHSDTIKARLVETCIELYGCPHPMQNSTVMDRAMKAAMKTKSISLPSGRVISVQGYEPFAINWLLENGYGEDDLVIENKSIEAAIGRITYQNTKGTISRYYPDIYIPIDNLIVEVKSDYTIKQNAIVNKRKRDACIVAGLNFKFMIISNNKNEIHIQWQ